MVCVNGVICKIMYVVLCGVCVTIVETANTKSGSMSVLSALTYLDTQFGNCLFINPIYLRIPSSPCDNELFLAFS